jgi:hypothetical protein
VVALGLSWLVVLVGLGTWGVLHSTQTDRGMTTVAEALPVVDHAASVIVQAATVDGQAVAAVSDFVAQSACHVSLVRAGGRYQRVVTVLVTPGREDDLLRRVAGRLPASYKAAVNAEGPAVLSADAGLFVGISGVSAGQGVVRFVLDTGDCRAVGSLPSTAGAPDEAERAPVVAALTRLGASATSWQRYSVACPGGGTLTTVEARATPGPAVPLDRALAPLADGAPVATGADLFGYVQGRAQVGVRSVEGGLDLTATVPCG